MKIAACLMVRDEEDAIAEWILYHHLIGFDAFIVADHMSSDRTAARALETRALADLRLFRLDVASPHLQAELYLRVCRHWAPEFDWIAFFDVDEFLVGPEGRSCHDLLGARADAAAVVIPWLMFGSSGHDEKPAGLMIENYRRRSVFDFRPNHHVKSIVRPSNVTACINAHCFEVDGTTVLPGGAGVAWESPGKLQLYPDGEEWRLHHYFTRSRRHWADRLKRGQLSQLTRTMADFDIYDRNEIADDSACRQAEALRRLLRRLLATADDEEKTR